MGEKKMHRINIYFTSSLQALKIQTLAALCDEFPFACIRDVCPQAIEPVFNSLVHLFITTHMQVVLILWKTLVITVRLF
jgi:hypothetical protein